MFRELRAFVFFAAQGAALGDQRWRGLPRARYRSRFWPGQSQEANGCGGTADAGLSPLRIKAVIVSRRFCCSSIHSNAATAPDMEISLSTGSLFTLALGGSLPGDDDLLRLADRAINVSAETVSVSTTRRRSSSSLFVALMALSGRPGRVGSLNFSVKVTPSLASSARVILAGANGAPPRSMRR